MELPGIGLAAVTTCELLPGMVELAGYYTPQDHTPHSQASSPDRETVYEYLRNRLPQHMVPAYLVELPSMPLLPDGKADRRNCPNRLAPVGSGHNGITSCQTRPARRRSRTRWRSCWGSSRCRWTVSSLTT